MERMRDVEATHFWFRARRRELAPWWKLANSAAPDGPWLDLGAGTGGQLEDIRSIAGNRQLLVLDKSEAALAQFQNQEQRLRADALKLPLATDSIAIASAHDVLEHVDCDGLLLEELARCMRADGQLILTVPAWPALFCDHDRALGHFRRYPRSGLKDLVEGAGFEVLELRGFNSLLLPAVGMWRAARALSPFSGPPRSDVRPLPGALNALLGGVMALESRLPEILTQSVGLSWWCRARRRTAR
ncbi:MAG: SAM-dependent methyltransferase [Candidatus Paceibacteria bacterium]